MPHQSPNRAHSRCITIPWKVRVGVCVLYPFVRPSRVANFALGDHQQGRTSLAVYDAEKNGQGASRHTQESSDINPSHPREHHPRARELSSCSQRELAKTASFPCTVVENPLLLGTTRPARRESRTQMGQTSLYSSHHVCLLSFGGRFHRRGLHRVHGIVHSVFY